MRLQSRSDPACGVAGYFFLKSTVSSIDFRRSARLAETTRQSGK
ncbi:hypothetical protein BURPS406E_H0350 [Burkholderia pseudomallei 406e]|uniref:Uncharacterized protein n=2 Tax=Burkholderia pseudomallei TaxID=28450 RepID=A0A0E1W149_BURPE|nr:hypothetical protein BMASAVP1_A2171 [Burkholderia mallei SAVP1]ABN82758.1 hypothetical protein BURPS668_2556 [Burkholderia pseudomallei 668]ABN89008.1 hypothetical protein BURPS1106A_2609 [Burkholderia pseudomallei 1106a]ABO04849.1 hypothetical protein BMA10247_1444 [Burkholderia mallei NCTC 10247]ACQ95473.1 conserved hypothetical protein [Burkholderia pseudomallei MSHR346]EBA50735.1 hypothetical protein BURPS305_7222 [Burkholderia pseudomallei 305]EDO84633.1 hypothetical protein BURPS406E